MWQPQSPRLGRVADAVYSLEPDDTAWMHGILSAVHLDCIGSDAAFVGLGEISDGRAIPIASVATDEELARECRRGASLLPAFYVGLRARSFASTDFQLVGHQIRDLPQWDFLESRDVQDVFVVSAFVTSGRFLAFGGHLPVAAERWPTSLVEEWEAVALHAAAGTELRHARATGRASVAAVFGRDGTCVHAEGDATRERTFLRESVRRLERSRSRFRDVPTPAEGRRPFVEARWTLVDQFDSDGKHFIVAYAIEDDAPGEEPKALEALSPQEQRVMNLIAAGWPFKLIAYQLGISEGAVASYAHRARTKLRTRQGDLTGRRRRRAPSVT